MKIMSRFNLKKYDKGSLLVQIESFTPEKIMNILWENKIYIKNLCKISITTIVFEINSKDYEIVEKIIKTTHSRIRKVERRGSNYFLLKIEQNKALLAGMIFSFITLYFLSTYIWVIEINTDRYVSPYEIRKVLLEQGVKPGGLKRDLDVYELEKKIIGIKDNIMWFKVRIEGSKLVVNIAERVTPPVIQPVDEEKACQLVSKNDGIIEYVYTTAGTSVVKKGDIVKKGQLLVKGEQGKEGSTYLVHAKGEVVAKTFYEDIRELPLKGKKIERTGRVSENIYIEILGKRIYFKKDLNNFDEYDKIEENDGICKKETFYEIVQKEFQEDREVLINSAVNNMVEKNLANLDNSVKLVDKIITTEDKGESIRIKILIIIEQNIAQEEMLK